MSDQVKILCVDDERNVLRALERIFLDDDYQIMTAGSGQEGLDILETDPDTQVVISDYRMPGMNGVDFLREVYSRHPDTIRIVLSGYADTASVVAAINEGQIYKFVPKPWNDDELRMTIAKAIETFALHRKNLELTEELRRKNEELSSLNDSLERLIAERTLELILQNRALQHTRNILQHLPVGVLALVPDGIVVQVNLEAANILKSDCEEILGKKIETVLPPALCDFVAKVLVQKNSCATLDCNGESLCVKGTCMIEDEQEGLILCLNRECRK